MSDDGLPFEYLNRDVCEPIQTVDLDFEQIAPGEIEGSAIVYRRDVDRDEIEFLIDGQPVEDSPVELDPSPLMRTRMESWRAINREELSISASPGVGTFEVQFGGLTRTVTLFGDLPDDLIEYHEAPNDDGAAGLDGDGEPAILAGSETDMFNEVNDFSSVYVDDGLADRSRVTARVNPVEDYPGFDPEAGYDFVRAGIMLRNSIPNDGDDSGYVHLFYSPTLDEVRLQADFDGTGDSNYGGDALSPIPAEPPVWLRLEREGDTFSSWVSGAATETPPPESQWELHRVETLPAVGERQDAGLYASHNNTEQITASFSDFDLLQPVPDGIDEYHSPAAGNALAGINRNGERVVITGRGTDVFGGINEFSSLYEPDAIEDPGGTVTTRVLPIDDFESGFARAGIMIRNSIPNDGDDSGYVHLYYTPTENDVRLQADFDGNGSSDYGGALAPVPDIQPPVWLRLTRSGGTFISEVAQDVGGEPGDWTQHREETLPNVAPVQDVGVYASNTAEERITATFGTVEIDNEADNT